MKTAHRNASQHKRRWQKDFSIFQKTINLLEPFSAKELLELDLPPRLSFDAIKNGKGCAQDFHDLAAVINVTIVRSQDIDPLCEQTADAAAAAMLRLWDRHERTGAWGFDGPALQEVEAAIDLHEQLCRLSTPLQMLEAMKQVVAIRAAAGVMS